MSVIGGLLHLQTAVYTPTPRRDYGYCKDVSNNPVVKRVLLFNQDTGEYKGSTTSRALDGYWEITGLDETLPANSITAIAIDDTNVYESVVKSHRSLKV